ncbi:MAG: hypothetical protein Q7T87_09670 [Polaromonas sp.]|nr:hypothetical protein [Polaromonas sp.]
MPTALPFPVAADTSKSPLWIVLIAGLLVLALGGGAYWYVQNRGMPAFGSMVGRDDVPATATDVTADAVKEEEIITEAAEAADEVMTEAEADVATDRAGPAETQAAPAPTVMAVPRPVERPVAVAPPAPLPPKPIPMPRPAPSVEQKPVLKFTPVDPQTARNLPPPPGGYVTAPPVTTASPGLPAVRVPSAGAGAASPEEACGRRVFLAMTMCIARQCETPQFTSHPQCVQLRQQEKARQEQNSLRN